MGPDYTLLIPVVSIICATVVLLQVFRAVIRRFERREPPDGLAEELTQLRDRLADVEATAMRIPELEERLDFAERLLAKSHEPDRLATP